MKFTILNNLPGVSYTPKMSHPRNTIQNQLLKKNALGG
jgi:hypothetical protein